MKKLDIVPVDPKVTIDHFVKNEKRFFMPAVHDKKGDTYFFKARLQDTHEVYRAALNEINFHKKIRPIAHQVRSHFIIPEYKKSGIEKDYGFIWFLREYQEGKFAGIMDLDIGYTDEFLKKISPDRLAKAVIAFQVLTKKVTKVIKVPKHGFNWYDTDFQYYIQKPHLQRFLKEEVPFIDHFYKSQKQFIEKNSNTLSHGDFYPNNVMVNPQGKLVLFDWELLNLNNVAFDPCFIYMLSWRRSGWRDKFLRTIYRQQKNQDRFQKLFRICVFSLSLRFVRHARLAKTNDYAMQMKKSGYPPNKIKSIRTKALKALPAHLKDLQTAIKKPNKFFQF